MKEEKSGKVDGPYKERRGKRPLGRKRENKKENDEEESKFRQ